MKRGLFFLFLVLILTTEGQSQETNLRSLLTGDDSRGWRAVGRLNIGEDGFCTGSLIADNLVLTAAHCVFDAETGERIPEQDIQFLADWRGGRASAYRGVKRALVHPGFANFEKSFVDRVAYDVAILELDQPIRNGSITPFTTDARPNAGAEVGVVSYALNREESPSLQEVCHVLARQNGSLILSCEVDFGSSGAPIFVIENGQPRIVSVVSAMAKVKDQPVALGTALELPLAELMAMRGQSDGVFGTPAPVVRRLTVTESHSQSGAKFLRP